MKNTRELLRHAIEAYGPDMQMTVAIEEMAELTKELCKYKRGIGSKEHIAEEIADVEIMLEQLKLIFDVRDPVRLWKNDKIERLEQRLSEMQK